MADPNKGIVKINVWKATKDIIDKRSASLNNDIKNLGINRGVPKTRFIDLIVKNSTVNLTPRDLRNITRRRR